ncbi:MAG: hypothetical protein ACQGVC_13165 [Myxococcota bacterium]
MRKLGFVCVLAGVLLIGGSAVLHWKGSLGAVPPEVVELERALARPGLIGLVTLDVAALVALGVAEGEPEGEPEGWRRDLLAAGIDLENDLDHATLALSASGASDVEGADDPGEAEAVLALFGRFDPAAVEAALRGADGTTVEDGELAGRPVLHVTRTDRDTCEESGPFAVHLGPGRILVAQAGTLAALLQGAPPADGALRDLTRFQGFRQGQLVSAAFFVPDALPDTGNPFVGMAAVGARQAVDGFRALYAGAAPRLVPPGVSVDAVLEGVEPGVASDRAAAWSAWLDEKLGPLGEKVPTLATLHEALELRAEGNDLHASFRLSQQDLERLEKLPDEMGSLIFGGGSFEMGGMSGQGGPVEERLKEEPLVFRPQVEKADLPAYDPGVPFAEPVDAVSGPLGLRVAAIRLGEGDAPSELEIEAFGTGIPNLGGSADRVSFVVTSLEGKGGEELLAREHCGPDRNDLPAVLSNHFGGQVLRGAKSLRLRPGAVPDDLARIVGTASVRLPVRTEALKLPAEPGVVEKAGARLEITSVAGGSVSYALSGEAGNLLHLRALNAAGRELEGNGSSSMSGFGSGRSGNEMFAGKVAGLEAVFAVEEEEIRFPFALSEILPGTAGEFPQPDDFAAPAGAVAIRGAFEDWLARVSAPLEALAVPGLGGGPSARPVRAGPFLVTLEGLWPFGGLMPRIALQAPDIPGLAGSANAVQIVVSELRMHDGTAAAGPWSETLALAKGWGRDALTATAQLETGVPADPADVASLRGEVRIRLPARLRTERIDDAELGAGFESPDLAVRLVELARDRFVLRATRGGERLLGAQALNAFGDMLWTTPQGSETSASGALELAFEVKGVPRQIELRVAEELARAAFPFDLVQGEREVATR